MVWPQYPGHEVGVLGEGERGQAEFDSVCAGRLHGGGDGAGGAFVGDPAQVEAITRLIACNAAAFTMLFRDKPAAQVYLSALAPPAESVEATEICRRAREQRPVLNGVGRQCRVLHSGEPVTPPATAHGSTWPGTRRVV